MSFGAKPGSGDVRKLVRSLTKGATRLPRTHKVSKHNAKRTEYDSVVYDSQMEADHAAGLDIRQKAGKIRWWLRQVPLPLNSRDNVTRIDFLVCGPDGSIWAEEVKGQQTQAWRKVRAQWLKHGLFPIHVYTRGKLIEEIMPPG